MEEQSPINIQELIQQVVSGLIKKLNIDSKVEVTEVIEGDKANMICNVETEESSYLIGQYGINLQALQHLARVIVRKKNIEKADFILDVNFYRQEKNQTISALAKNMAERVIAEQRAVTLRPMTPYERRLVHMELAENDKIKTESIGDGENRQVIIKPL